MLSEQTIETIKDEAKDRLEEIFLALGADPSTIRNYGHRISCKCFVHEGTGIGTMSMYRDSFQWKCFSRKCEEGNYGLFGLISTVLKINFHQSVSWLNSFLDLNVNLDENIVTDPEQMELIKLTKKKPVQKQKEYKIPIASMPDLEPSQYFIDKGFSEKTLKKYMVGFCNDRAKPMYNRSFAPVLDETGKFIIGASGRIIYDECQYCCYCHPQGQGCPNENPTVRYGVKWLHKGFKTGDTFYPQWFAGSNVIKTKTAILTEGLKEIWKLDQWGINNALSLFGLNLGKYHVKRLLKMGCMNLVLGFDSDIAGKEAVQHISNNVSDYFKVHNLRDFIKSDQDIDEIDIDDLNSIKEFINNL